MVGSRLERKCCLDGELVLVGESLWNSWHVKMGFRLRFYKTLSCLLIYNFSLPPSYVCAWLNVAVAVSKV